MNLKRYISLLLAVMLFIGMIPYARATEVSAAEETVASTEPATDTTSPTEPTDPPEDEAPDCNDIAAYASTQKSILLFDYTDNGDYTTRLNSQVACTYKLNGTGATKTAYVKNLGWHFARYNNTPYPDDPLYCIEPWRNYGASTSGNSVDRDVTLDGSGSTTGSNVWYVMGTFGQVLTKDLLATKLQQLPDAIGPYEDYIRANYLGVRTADCIGLIKGYSWYDPETGSITYSSNGMPDISADQIYNVATEKGTISTIPEIPGLIVHATGHVGIYIGNGYVIEAKGTRYGVVKTALSAGRWTGWCKNPYINYVEDADEEVG